jgi:hypothetical protein
MQADLKCNPSISKIHDLPEPGGKIVIIVLKSLNDIINPTMAA